MWFSGFPVQRDIAVLQYQNQKLVQKLESQKVEHAALESKLSQLTEQQLGYDARLEVVGRSWEEVIALSVFSFA